MPPPPHLAFYQKKYAQNKSVSFLTFLARSAYFFVFFCWNETTQLFQTSLTFLGFVVLSSVAIFLKFYVKTLRSKKSKN